MTPGSHRARLAVSLPLRLYIRKSPLRRGKGFLMRRVLKPLLPPPPSSFETVRPGGSRVRLYFRETLGLATITFGNFEDAECRLLCKLATAGGMAIDVGANVGAIAIPLARAVGPDGVVVAIEPLADNVRRLQANADLNGLANILIRQLAASGQQGRVDLQVAEDSAYGSIHSITPGMANAGVVSVEAQPLDKVWDDLDSPRVSVIKIDVEGAEAEVIRGASKILGRDRPALMIEAETASELAEVARLLEPYGYAERQASGFMPWNHLFSVGDVVA